MLQYGWTRAAGIQTAPVMSLQSTATVLTKLFFTRLAKHSCMDYVLKEAAGGCLQVVLVHMSRKHGM